jgi:integrase/recombinase XerC
VTPATWAACLAGFRTYVRELGRLHSTWETYAAYLHRLAADHPDPLDVDAAQLAAWLYDVPGWSDQTRRSALATLRVFYGWMVRAGHLEVSPAAGLVSPVRSSAGDRAAPVLSAAWCTALDDFEQSLRAAGRAAGTIRLRRWHLGQLAGLYADPFAVSGGDLAAWLSGPSWAPESRKSARASLRVFYRWAALSGRLSGPSPADQLEPVAIPPALPRPASEAGITAALAAGTDRDRLMLLLGAYAGLRCMEIARVHPRDVVDGQTLRVTGKGRRQRLVPLHPLIVDELGAELARRRAGGHGTGWRWTNGLTADGWLFPNAHGDPVGAGAVVKALSAVLGGDLTAHQLRHRFATAAYAVQKDLRAVQDLLGHSKPETTARYTAVPDDAKRTAVFGIGGGS